MIGAREALGFEFDPPAFRTDANPNVERATFRSRKVLGTLVHDAVALEGNPFTIPEVITLLEGITVGGRHVADAEQVLNTAKAWKMLLDHVKDGFFDLSAKTATSLQGVGLREEALKWGAFRTGGVRVAGTDMRVPFAATLPEQYENGRAYLETIEPPHARAIAAFLFVARNQFFWDGNKRTGRLLMNGVLLSNGYDAINVPFARREEFNAVMIDFYDTLDAKTAIPFLASCSHDDSLKIGRAKANRVVSPRGARR